MGVELSLRQQLNANASANQCLERPRIFGMLLYTHMRDRPPKADLWYLLRGPHHLWLCCSQSWFLARQPFQFAGTMNHQVAQIAVLHGNLSASRRVDRGFQYRHVPERLVLAMLARDEFSQGGESSPRPDCGQH